MRLAKPQLKIDDIACKLHGMKLRPSLFLLAKLVAAE
jgi:hypothetical protein